MTEALKCPECSAPLDLPANGSRTLRCAYCQCTVLVTGSNSDSRDVQLQVVTPADPDRASAVAELIQQIQTGNLIQAIKLYRQQYGGGLRTAKAAVEDLRAGRQAASKPGLFDPARVGAARPLSAGLGCAAAIVALAVTVVIFVGFIARALRPAPAIHLNSVPPMTLTPRASIQLPTPAPAPPAFANQVIQFGASGIGAGQFKDARSIALDGNGHIYVGEYSGGRVQVFDVNGKFLTTWSAGPKAYISNLAANRAGTLLAVMQGKILCFEGITGRAFGEAARIKGDGPYDAQETYRDACYALNGDIYAIDNDSNIVILDPDGKIRKVIPAKQNTGDDEVSFDKIAVNGNNQVYAIARGKGLFQFAPDGRYINRFGISDDGDPTDRRPDTLRGAFNLAIDGQGRIYVADMMPAIKVFDKNGRYLDAFGGNEVCFGLAVDDQNQILGCFRNQHQIRKFDLAKK